ncbi:hypothetical protein ONZ43_g6510 [Nemania bipapillata]|uniref:Uncharacterized protein n=1 Tax=Nemania bipapillata TaxID=110536 RepID=A0ACC2HZD0_9PEZI|nr:hypothetical protein ONZ43_g6510 [Nemania bipapillata]
MSLGVKSFWRAQSCTSLARGLCLVPRASPSLGFNNKLRGRRWLSSSTAPETAPDPEAVPAPAPAPETVPVPEPEPEPEPAPTPEPEPEPEVETVGTTEAEAGGFFILGRRA